MVPRARSIHDGAMRPRALAPVALVTLLGVSHLGCAHSSRMAESATEDTTVARSERRAEDPAIPETAFEEPAPAPRPRLSRTITLGQGETVYGEARPPAAAGAPGGPTVIVNNQVVVSPGYGYGYGYGYGGGFGRGVRSDVAPAGFGATGTGSFSSSNPPGWEGARRTAPPGQTPGVGGNWAPPASYGPAPMR